MGMIDKLISLYSEGRLSGGLFEKTARIIMKKELEKLAFIGPMPADKVISSAGSLYGPASTVGHTALRHMKDKVNSSGIDYLDDLLSNATSRTNTGLGDDALDEVMRMAKHRYDALTSGTSGNMRMIASKLNKPLGGRGFPIAVGLATALGLAGASKLKDAYDEHKLDSIQNQNFAKILAESPGMDAARAARNFKALQAISPDMASNPAMAEGYLRQMDQFDVLDIAPVQALSMIQKNIEDAKSKREGNEQGVSNSASELAGALAALVVLG